MGDLGLPELLVIALLAVLLFGTRRIPEVAKGLGEGIRSFKLALRGEGSADAAQEQRESKLS